MIFRPHSTCDRGSGCFLAKAFMPRRHFNIIALPVWAMTRLYNRQTTPSFCIDGASPVHLQTDMPKGTKTNRDDFTTIQKLDLAKRVNYRCSICDAQTTGPILNSTKAMSVGEAAHIKAAAPGGPRFDPTQTPEERKSSDNAIFACTTCATIIDRDEDAYPVEKLLRLKAAAEARATHRLGKTPTPSSLTLRTPSEIKRAVQLFCLAEAVRQEELDPRFEVKVHWQETGLEYHLRPKELVSAKIVVAGRDRTEHEAALRDFFAFGGVKSFESIDVRLEGSPLFEVPDDVPARLKLTSEEVAATVSIVLRPQSDRAIYIDFIGSASRGNMGIRFSGSTYGGLITATSTVEFGAKLSNMTLSFNLSQWASKPVRHLPKFDQVKEVAFALATRVGMEQRWCANEQEYEIGTGTMDGSEGFGAVRAFLAEAHILRKLDKFFGLDLVVPADLDDMFRDRGDIAQWLPMIDVHDAADPKIGFTLVPFARRDHVVEALQEKKERDFRIRQQVAFRIFGKTYGPYEVEVDCASSLVTTVGPTKVTPGVPVDMWLKPAPGKKWSSRSLGLAKDSTLSFD
jgi:hypothetical protein